MISRVIERDLFTSLLATFGLAIMMAQILNLLFGSDTQSIDLKYETLHFGPGDFIVHEDGRPVGQAPAQSERPQAGIIATRTLPRQAAMDLHKNLEQARVLIHRRLCKTGPET